MLRPISLVLVLSGAVLAQFSITPKSKAPAPATYVTPSDMEQELKTAPNPDAHLIDRPVRVIEAGEGGSHQVGVAIVKRTAADQDALIHDRIDEIYYILDGGGTMVTGGKLVDEKHTETSATIGPGWRGSSIQGGAERRVNKGDVVFITAGTPHMFTKLDGPIRYMVYRVDFANVLALK
jgi:mannose-6-phosphate isomerase-like protein (cupin superfamily)